MLKTVTIVAAAVSFPFNAHSASTIVCHFQQNKLDFETIL